MESNERKMTFDAFAREQISPYVDEIDRTGVIPKAVLEAIKKSGYLGSMISVAYGGMGLDNVSIGLLNSAVGYICTSTRSLLTVHGMVALAIEKWGTNDQKEKYLPAMACGDVIGAFALSEPQTGSDTQSIECEAIKTENGYLLNGTKKWTTMSQIADIILIIAKWDGRPTAFLVERETPGLTILPLGGLMGARGSMMSEIQLNDCFVSDDRILAAKGYGLSHVAMYSLDYGRYTVAWGCVGMCRACLNRMLEYSKERKQFGMLLRKHELIQKMITETLVHTKAAELLCKNAGELKDQGSPDSIIETWNAKYFASKAANLVAGHAIQVMGANGCIEGSVVERFYRDAKLFEIIEGSSQIHEILIAHNAIKSVY